MEESKQMPPIVRKPTEDEFKEFLARIVRESAPRIVKCTIPLYAWIKNLVELKGTGTLFRIGDRHFVLSAAHVLDYPGIFSVPYCTSVCDEGSPLLLNMVKIVSSPLPPGADKFDIDMRDADPFDIAVAELHPDSATKLEPYWRFAQLQELDVFSPSVEGSYFVLGFPVERTSTDFAARSSDTKALSYSTELHNGSRDDRDKEADLLLAYPRQNQTFGGQIVIAPNPKGISGCGIWRLARQDKLIDDWHDSDVRLVGIEHRWRSAHRYLVGTAVRHAIRLIYNRYQDLHPSMDIVYGKTGIILP